MGTLVVELRATFEDVEWQGEDEDPDVTGGFTDPDNPWGGFRSEIPYGLCGEAFTRWAAENVRTVTVDLLEAAERVLDFPGGVWDFRESESEQDHRTGVWTSVTLHVETHAAAVFELAERMRACADLRA